MIGDRARVHHRLESIGAEIPSATAGTRADADRKRETRPDFAYLEGHRAILQIAELLEMPVHADELPRSDL